MPEGQIRVGQMVEHARADDLVECLAELPDLLDRQPMEIEVLQSIFLLKIARVVQAGFADVDCRDPGIRLAQRMDSSLGCSAAGDQDLLDLPAASPSATADRDSARRRSGFR